MHMPDEDNRWADILDDLGIAEDKRREPQPPLPSPTHDAVEIPLTENEPAESEAPPRRGRRKVSPENSTESVVEMSEEPVLPNVEAADEPEDVSPALEPVSELEEDGDKKRRRRRGRRKKKDTDGTIDEPTSEDLETLPPTMEIETPSLEEPANLTVVPRDQDSALDSSDEDIDEENDEGTSETGSSSEAESEKKRKRRRRRKKRTGERATAAVEMASPVQKSPPTPPVFSEVSEQLEDEDDVPPQTALATEGEDDDDDDIIDMSNWAITSWQDLIASLYRPER